MRSMLEPPPKSWEDLMRRLGEISARIRKGWTKDQAGELEFDMQAVPNWRQFILRVTLK